MFEINDFWNIFSYIKGDDSGSDLDSTTRALSKSELAVAQTLFENTIDQVAFTSSDYRRLRSFLINWYASHRVLTSTQKSVSDPFLIPSEHLDELFKSFGFKYSPEIKNFTTKVNFFLDLVNLYKIKGSPGSLSDVLSYFGLKESTILEYFLKIDSNNRLVFSPINATSDAQINLNDISFTGLTSLDPHWMQTESDIRNLLLTNKINLPSKTPYFSIKPSFSFNSPEPILAYYHRICSDAYKDFLNTGNLQTRDIYISKMNLTISISELNLACIIVFNETYGELNNTSDSRYMINDSTATESYTIFKSDYQDYINTEPESRIIRKNNLIDFNKNFSRKLSNIILDSPDKVKLLLSQMNSTLKNELDAWAASGKINELFPNLLNTLDEWLDSNIEQPIPRMSLLVLGIDGLEKINEVINFFKPYRARFLALELEYYLGDRLRDSIKIDADINETEITDTIVDIATADGEPCCPDPETDCETDNESYYQRLTFDCESRFDVGAADDDEPEVEITFDPLAIDNFIDCRVDHSQKIESGYRYLDLGNPRFDEKIRELGLLEEVHQSSGWAGTFDEEDITFDCYSGRDICSVEITNMGYHFEEIVPTDSVINQNSELIYEDIRGESCINPELTIETITTFDSTSVESIIITSGFADFDLGASFDEPCGKEVVQIDVLDYGDAVSSDDPDASTFGWFTDNDELVGSPSSPIKTVSQQSVKTYLDNILVYTDQKAKDAVGGILDNGSLGSVKFVYNKSSDKIYANLDGGTF